MSVEIQTDYHPAPPPASFNRAEYQRRIDRITGTRDGRPLIKLAWAPEELRWMPHRLGEDALGYTFPIFCIRRNGNKQYVAPERWVLLERIEPEQYAAEWEGKRYINWHGSVWDVKGPCPSEKYVELRCHSYHDGQCCPCIGDTCNCGEQYDHCWGKYAEPNEDLLNWIRRTAWESRRDPDVQPTEDIRHFTAPHAQRELQGNVLAAQEEEQHQFDDLDREVNDYWNRKSHSVTLLNQSVKDEMNECSY